MVLVFFNLVLLTYTLIPNSSSFRHIDLASGHIPNDCLAIWILFGWIFYYYDKPTVKLSFAIIVTLVGSISPSTRPPPTGVRRQEYPVPSLT